MTIRETMLRAIQKNYKSFRDHTLTMQDLDDMTLTHSPRILFTAGSARRTVQELVAEGVLTRKSRGVYQVNQKRLAQALKGIF